MESFNLPCDPCHEKNHHFVHSHLFHDFARHFEVPQSFQFHALTIPSLKHIGQLPVSLICADVIAYFEEILFLSQCAHIS